MLARPGCVLLNDDNCSVDEIGVPRDPVHLPSAGGVGKHCLSTLFPLLTHSSYLLQRLRCSDLYEVAYFISVDI